MNSSIDLNSDLGEQLDSVLDEGIMPYISSCNIACGGHAGSEGSVRRTIKLAIENEVAIGAHPGYPDPENFGREVMEIESGLLKESLRNQILLVKRLTEGEGKKLHHVKPHGALYNFSAMDKKTSSLICDLLKEIDPKIKLFGLAHSISEKVALEKGLTFVGEAFADRRYEKDRTLRSRKFENAVLHKELEVLDQVEKIALKSVVESEGELLHVKAKTICLHSDTKGAVNLAKSIHDHLVKKGVTITSV